ncbi:putative nucleoside-diphosphate-sugar epimerase protein [Phaeoacremonium minimum UCRPA7]|uniref:Putative nucleoside-diphosphate-sugar epimerase protein n=1 Tax=Phaeoacremonium minimum (strain UCR-PA7) TaxID=1286976 RepID=R8BE22_PHAM7|nr:putative nucleoside-diphosphate-sugar epimerase protein [Phaeoacremonium minimum UCRPA7]EON97520.1 putative nucleoside-diphosphate-sugar epimerase protein [Phaeoacremonium minimum UCRPA7]
MRVFVTGSTGFVGTAVVKELLSAGHRVLGLTRSNKGVEQLRSLGAEALFGTIQDIEILQKGAFECDAVIHLAFIHDFADFMGACATDRAAITAMGSVLAAAKGDRALVITSGTMVLARSKLGKEDDGPDVSIPLGAARGASEAVCLDFAKQGVRASVVRLPPTTHGPGVSGFSGPFVTVALQKGVSAYVGDGQNCWCAGHRDDAAKLYRLAVEKGKAGSVYHAVAEESVAVKDVATEVGKQLDIPVVSITPEEVNDHFGWFHFGAVADNTASSVNTRAELGWTPSGATLLEDIPIIVDFIKAQVA